MGIIDIGTKNKLWSPCFTSFSSQFSVSVLMYSCNLGGVENGWIMNQGEKLRNKRKKRIAETDAVQPPWGQRKVAVVEKWSLWGGGVSFFGGFFFSGDAKSLFKTSLPYLSQYNESQQKEKLRSKWRWRDQVWWSLLYLYDTPFVSSTWGFGSWDEFLWPLIPPFSRGGRFRQVKIRKSVASVWRWPLGSTIQRWRAFFRYRKNFEEVFIFTSLYLAHRASDVYVVITIFAQYWKNVKLNRLTV